MKLTLSNQDTICIQDCKIAVFFENREYMFVKEEIEAAMIITTDKGPFYDDYCEKESLQRRIYEHDYAIHMGYGSILFYRCDNMYCF